MSKEYKPKDGEVFGLVKKISDKTRKYVFSELTKGNLPWPLNSSIQIQNMWRKNSEKSWRHYIQNLSELISKK